MAFSTQATGAWLLSKFKYLLRGILRRSQDAGDRLIKATLDDVKKSVFSTSALTKWATLGIAWLFREYLEPGSLAFFFLIGWLIFIFCITWTRFRLWAIPAILPLLVIVPITFFEASYYIASDQFRIKYRTVEGVAYFEFPARLPFVSQMVRLRENKELIEINRCNDQAIAKLPLLPYAPIHIDRDLLFNPFEFRRLPYLQIERLDSNLSVASGSVIRPDGEKKSSASVQFGLPSSLDTASVPVTLIFPRSTTCTVNGVPLLPILEELPWESSDTDTLIKAVIRSDRLRKLYPDNVLSLEQAHGLQMNVADSNSYKALFDFVFYSIAYHTFSGNVLSEVRSKIGNKLCSIADSHANAFSGAFATLPEQFLKHIVDELGSKYQSAYPTCHMPNEMFETFQSLIGDKEETPAFVTFRHCLETSGSVSKCLEQDDAAQPRKGCSQPFLCGKPRSYALQEPLLEFYDEKFEDFVATNDGKTVEIRTLSPTDCPKLRDRFEESQFVNWWRAQANAITEAPASCSSADWNRKIAESKALIGSVISCANKLGLSDVPKLEDATFSIDTFYNFRCNAQAGAVNTNKVYDGLANLMGSIEPTISKLKEYEGLIGDQTLDSLIDLLEMRRKSRDAVCGVWSVRQCAKELQAKGNLADLLSMLNPIAEGNISAASAPEEIVRRLTNLHNRVMDMAICDLLQDEEFAKQAGYSRVDFCDSHTLQAYRLFGSSDLGRSVERSDDDASKKGYFYRLNKSDKEYLIQVPLGDRPKSP